jgi:hypothetical protein
VFVDKSKSKLTTVLTASRFPSRLTARCRVDTSLFRHVDSFANHDRCELSVRAIGSRSIAMADRLPRSFTTKQAKSLGVTGFVTNASDGTVCSAILCKHTV